MGDGGATLGETETAVGGGVDRLGESEPDAATSPPPEEQATPRSTQSTSGSEKRRTDIPHLRGRTGPDHRAQTSWRQGRRQASSPILAVLPTELPLRDLRATVDACRCSFAQPRSPSSPAACRRQ